MFCAVWKTFPSSSVRFDPEDARRPQQNECLPLIPAATVPAWRDRAGTNAVFGISDANPEAIFTYAARQLSKRNLAYLHVLEPALDSGSPMSAGLPLLAPALREAYDGLMILNGSLTQQTGQSALTSDAADAIAFGVPFISNPDLVERLRNNITLSKPNPDTFYGGGAEGYTDYPAKVLQSA